MHMNESPSPNPIERIRSAKSSLRSVGTSDNCRVWPALSGLAGWVRFLWKLPGSNHRGQLRVPYPVACTGLRADHNIWFHVIEYVTLSAFLVAYVFRV